MPDSVSADLKQGRCRKGFKPDVAADAIWLSDDNHIRLRGVGWNEYRKSVALAQDVASSRPRENLRQNGLTITMMTIPIMRTVGISLIIL